MENMLIFVSSKLASYNSMIRLQLETPHIYKRLRIRYIIREHLSGKILYKYKSWFAYE